jgi:hypothetical protein
MLATSNSLTRSMLRSLQIGAVEKAGHDSQKPSEHCGPPTLGEHNEIVLRDFWDIQQISSRVSKARRAPSR